MMKPLPCPASTFTTRSSSKPRRLSRTRRRTRPHPSCSITSLNKIPTLRQRKVSVWWCDPSLSLSLSLSLSRSRSLTYTLIHTLSRISIQSSSDISLPSLVCVVTATVSVPSSQAPQKCGEYKREKGGRKGLTESDIYSLNIKHLRVRLLCCHGEASCSLIHVLFIVPMHLHVHVHVQLAKFSQCAFEKYIFFTYYENEITEYIG